MDAASGAAGAAANGANAGAVVKALQLPPNTKNVVMALVTGAMEGLSTIQTALQDAEETDGATMPAELLGAIEQSGMELVAFAQQHAANGAEGGEHVDMSAPEVEIANALVDGAPDIAKSLFIATAKNARAGVKKASLKVAPAHVVSLIKELLDDFVGRASKWGGMFTGDAPAAAQAAPDASVAAAKKDASATLKSVRDASVARVAKSSGAPGGDTELADALAALKTLPQMQAALVKLQKSFVGGDYVDPADEFAALADENTSSTYMPGDNIAASVRAEIRKNKGASTQRVIDEDDEDI
jgi:hypothetical protein